MNFPKSAKNITKQRCPVHNGFLVEALLEVRELVPSGSEAMGIIDEALGRVGISPWKKVRTQWWGRTGVK
jgi:hypothetical protein